MYGQGEELIGARAWRVLFGVVSLPLAVTAVAYFINHRYDGVQLWDIKVPKRLEMQTRGWQILIRCWYERSYSCHSCPAMKGPVLGSPS